VPLLFSHGILPQMHEKLNFKNISQKTTFFIRGHFDGQKWTLSLAENTKNCSIFIKEKNNL
jgi:hypothetical protein